MMFFYSLYNSLMYTWLGPWCTILLYGCATILQWRRLRMRHEPMWSFLLVSVLAVVLHGMLLHHWIDVLGVQNLSAGNLFSLLCWTMSVTLLLMAWRSYMLCLSVLLYPLAMVSIIWVLCYPLQTWVRTMGDSAILLHIFLAILVVNMLALSALLAMLMAWQERRIRGHHLGMLDRHLPSLVLVEQHVFQMMCVGFLLLSAMLTLGIEQYGWQPWSFTAQRYQVTLVVLAWLIFAGALLSRWLFGYRGPRVVYITLLGVVLLLFVHLGIHGRMESLV